jgi:hypothetical protein
MENLLDQEGEKIRLDIFDILDAADNVAELLSDEKLDAIGRQAIEDYELDKRSMGDWIKAMEQAIKLASQTIESKTVPWPNASNVKHALILEACIQFSARALPEIIRDNKVVRTKIFGKDPQATPQPQPQAPIQGQPPQMQRPSGAGQKHERAIRVEKWMNYDILEGMVDWDGDLDRALIILAMMGTIFKKTFYCPVSNRNKSILCLPDKIIINQSAPSLAEARRISHEIELFDNDIAARVRAGAFLDVELMPEHSGEESESDQSHTFIEQMRYLDLDGDGYPEWYAVTVHEPSAKVVRITPAFYERDIDFDFDDRGKVVVNYIERSETYADYHFIHSIDGTFYSYGFGYLLSHATHTINTLLNQIIDAGTLDNLQSGFIGKGARIRGGQISFEPGKWIKADASGVDLKNSIVPLPTKGPSQVLLSLVQFLLQSYYRMISISDIMSGQVSGSNTTAAEAMQAVEQGMKVMNSIYKRIYRGLKKEFKQLYKLYQAFPQNELYREFLDEPNVSMEEDFAIAGLDLVPVADASMSTQLEETMRLRSVIELQQFLPEMQRVPLGRRLLQAMRVENVDEILPMQDPNAPSPQQQEMARMLQEKEEELAFRDREIRVKEGELQLDSIKLQYELAKLMAETEKIGAQAQKEGASVEIEAYLAQVRKLEAQAKYIQAITPDQGSNDGNTRAARDMAR